MKKETAEAIKQYMLKNPMLMHSDYAQTAKLFDTTYERVRHIARKLRKPLTEVPNKEETSFSETKSGAIVECKESKRVKSLEDLLNACKVDQKVWEVAKYDIGTYEVTGFNKKKEPITIPMFRTKAFLQKVNPLLDIERIRKDLIDDLTSLFDFRPKKLRPDAYKDDDPHMIEINAFDLHLGKIGINGDEYSLEIARERMLSAIQHLIKISSGYYIDQILFTVGNDFLNSDGDWPVPSTTKGTPQFNSDKHIEMYRYGRKLLMECIEILKEIAPVHVKVVPGNHDRESMMHLGDALEVFYDKDENVTVDNSNAMMKAFRYGRCLVVSDHGDGAKLNDLPGIVSQRYRDIWSEVYFVEVHRGHLHTNRAFKMQSVEELQGLTVRYLSSMCATDEWHDMNGYVGNIKRASAFIWSKYNGLQAKLNYNVPV